MVKGLLIDLLRSASGDMFANPPAPGEGFPDRRPEIVLRRTKIREFTRTVVMPVADTQLP